MCNLYPADLKRIFKDKLFLVACILAGVFAVINPLLYKLLFEVLQIGDMLGALVNAKTLFFTAFLPGDNLGLVMPILIAIIVCKDFSQGTVRNKIISGKSRVSIYFSHLFAATTVVCGVMLAHGLLTLGISLCFFPYSAGSFTLAEFGYVMASLAFEMLVYFAVSAIVTFFATISKNIGICLLLYLAAAFGASIVGSIFSAAYLFVDPETTAYGILEFVNAMNIYTSALIGAGTTYSLKDVAYILLPSLLTLVGTTLLGLRLFARKNLK